MSGLNAIGAQNIAFMGHKEVKKEEKPEEKKQGKISLVKDKLTKPIRDDFKKSYKTGIKDATPEMVADYVADNAVKAITLIGGGALLLSKSRKLTNGLTASFKSAIENVRSTKGTEQAPGAIKKLTSIVSGTIEGVRNNNFNRVRTGLENGATKPRLRDSVKDAILMPVKEFDNNGKLGKFVDSASGVISGACKKLGIKGKEGAELTKDVVAQNMKKGFMKVGIGNGEQLADTALATGAAVLSTGVSMNVADDTTKADNKTLAAAARAQKALNAVDNIAKTAARFTEIAESI